VSGDSSSAAIAEVGGIVGTGKDVTVAVGASVDVAAVEALDVAVGAGADDVAALVAVGATGVSVCVPALGSGGEDVQAAIATASKAAANTGRIMGARTCTAEVSHFRSPVPAIMAPLCPYWGATPG